MLRDKNCAIMLIDKSVLKISKYLCTRTKYRLNKNIWFMLILKHISAETEYVRSKNIRALTIFTIYSYSQEEIGGGKY